MQKFGQLEEIPAVPGAYGLLIRLVRPLTLRCAKFKGLTVDIGLYLYAGSAYGPGGLSARVSRHLRKDKKLHWHVDELTVHGRVETVFVVPHGAECDIVQSITKSAAASHPIPGFGSSDCHRCEAHLIGLQKQSSIPVLASLIGATGMWTSP